MIKFHFNATFVEVALCEATRTIAVNTTGVGDNSSIQKGDDDEAPEDAGIKAGNFFGESIFD